MTRAAILLIGLLLPVAATAQDAAGTPIVRTDFEATSAVPGQPVVMRLTVLVPTWMPEPPVLPTYDLPNLMVRNQGRASTAISEDVDGETWSGISRKYLMYPLIAGRIEIPAQTVTIQYADPGTREPIRFEATVEAATLTGEVPEGAAGLEPFIAATSLEIEQSIEGEPEGMKPGDALVRQLIVRIKGTSPMVVPRLLDPQAGPGLSVYPDEPVLKEAQDRGVLSGSRTERVTYVPEAGGRFTGPAVSVKWFNLETGEIETATAERFEITAEGPPPATAGGVDWRRRALDRAPLVLALVIAAAAGWRLWPRIARWRQRRRQAYLASERYAFQQAARHLGARRFDEASRAVRHWWDVASPGSGDLPPPLLAALAAIGAERYGAGARGGPGQAHGSQTHRTQTNWAQAIRALTDSRQSVRAAGRAGRDAALPRLNPVD